MKLKHQAVIEYTLSNKYELFTNNKLTDVNVRSMNKNGYIINRTYRSYNNKVVIENAKMLSCSNILTFNGNLFNTNGKLIAKNIEKIASDVYAMTNSKLLYNVYLNWCVGYIIEDIYYNRGTVVVINKYNYKIVKNGEYIYLLLQKSKYRDDYNIYDIVINSYINPLCTNELNKAKILLICLDELKIRLPRTLIVVIWRFF